MRFTRREFMQLISMGLAGLSCPGAARKVCASSAGPVTGASRGKNWAMVIDLNGCTDKEGCKDCIEACHRIHNVPRFTDVKRQIKWIWNSPYEELFPEQSALVRHELRGKQILALCNHCENPPCVSVCPTKATFKRADGIVMMDYHRCIGCRYCMAACPYGIRVFNWGEAEQPVDFTIGYGKDYRTDGRLVFTPDRPRGVVEKCTLCVERIDEGVQPFCVEVCPVGARVFGDLADPESEVSQLVDEGGAVQLLPDLGTDPRVFYLPVDRERNV